MLVNLNRSPKRYRVACVAAVSFPFPDGEIKQASEQARERTWGEQSGEGLSDNGEGVGRKGHFFPSPRPFLCSLFFAFARGFVSFECFLETPASQATPRANIFYLAILVLWALAVSSSLDRSSNS